MNQENDLSARLANLTGKIEAMEVKGLGDVKSAQNNEVCGICDIDEHPTHDCPNLPILKESMLEQVNVTDSVQKPYPSPYS